MPLRPIPRRVSVGRFNGAENAQLAASVTSTNSVPSSRVRRQAYTPGGMANLAGPGAHRYWRGGNLRQSWANEDDPGVDALFYTARDLQQTPDGQVYYDGDDDDAAVGAFAFLRKLFAKGAGPNGVAPPTDLRRGTGGTKAKPLAGPLGVETRWKKHELAPGLQLRLRAGTKAAVANVGTADAPIWQITVGVRNPTTGAFDGAGILPLLALALKGGAAAASNKAAKRMQAKAAAGQPLDEDGGQVRAAPGQTVQLGDMIGSLCEEPDTGSCEDVQTGALMIDSDGRKIEI